MSDFFSELNITKEIIKCADCGKFLDVKTSIYHFTPDTEFTHEESYWICKKCKHSQKTD